MAPDFVPTADDVFFFKTCIVQGIEEFKCSIDPLQCGFLYRGAVGNGRVECFEQLESVRALIFIVDLDAQSQKLEAPDNEGGIIVRSRLEQDQSLYKTLCQAPWLSDIPIIINFLNTDLCQEMLNLGSRSQERREYEERICSRFRQINIDRSQGRGGKGLLYALFADSSDSELEGLLIYLGAIIIREGLFRFL